MPKPNKANLLIYKALSRAMEQDLLRIYLDTSKLNRPNSPVYNPWENLLPLLIPTLIGLILIVTVSSFFGLAFIIGMILVYTYYFKRMIDKRLLLRTKQYIATDYTHCDELWQYGGLVLATAADKKVGCIAPSGDWKEFIVQNFADLMTDKPAEPQEKKDETAAA